MKIDIQRLWALILTAFVAVLPFGPALPNILAGILLAFALFQIIRGKFVLSNKDFVHFAYMNAFILFLFVSLLWSENLEYGLDKLLLLTFIPLFFLAILSSKRYLNVQLLVRISETFLLSTAVLLLLSFIAAVSQNGLSISSVTQNNLSTALVDFHYLGFSLYLAWALVLGLYVYLAHKELIRNWFLKIWPFCLVLIGSGLILLSSRTTIFIALAAVLLTLFLLRKKIRKKQIGAIVMVAVLGSFILITANSVLREKMKDAINYDNKYDIKEYWGGRGFRELIWNCAWYLIEQHPLVGTGFGDQQDEMELCYRKHRYQQLLLRGNTFNTHNLFLQMWVASGTIGLLLFLLAFAYPSSITIKRKKWLYLYFVLLILGTGITESHFNRNAIVSLFALFNPLIFYLTLSDESTSDSQ